MNEPHRNILTGRIDKISRCLHSIDNICNSLVAANIFTVEESEDVMNETAQYKKATQLVNYLLKASDRGFFIFVTS